MCTAAKPSLKPVKTGNFLFSIFPLPSLIFLYLEFAFGTMLTQVSELDAKFLNPSLPRSAPTPGKHNLIVLLNDTVIHCLDES